MAGVDYPRNWHELLAWFPEDAACLRYLENLRWRDGFVCDSAPWSTAAGGRWATACAAAGCAAARLR